MIFFFFPRVVAPLTTVQVVLDLAQAPPRSTTRGDGALSDLAIAVLRL